MFLADYHTHSLCSPDGSAPLTEMARAALEAGLNELCLTDHCDFIDYDGHPDFSFRWAPIEEQLALARPRFEGKLPIKMGLELGEAWEAPALVHLLLSHPELDFVLGSVHNLPLREGGVDLYNVHYDSDERCYADLDRYFDSMETLVGMGCFDVLAHVIYPLRYMNVRDGCHATLDRYRDRLAAMFDTLIAQGKGVELNTCRGTTVEDWRWTMTLYRDRGGEIVTLGSDAHAPADVGKGLRAGAELLRELGFRYLATYERRSPKLIKL